MKNFSTRLRRLRGKSTLAEFSTKNGINLKTYQHYESGTRKPNVKAILQIAVNCNISADWLLGLSEEMNPSIRPASMPERGLSAADPREHAYLEGDGKCPYCSAKQAQIDKLIDTLHQLSLGRSQTARNSSSAPIKY